MRIFNVELEMSVGMHVDNDGSIVGDIVKQVLEVLFVIAESLDTLLQFILFQKV